jgi:hypothetical protein
MRNVAWRIEENRKKIDKTLKRGGKVDNRRINDKNFRQSETRAEYLLDGRN